MRRCLLGFHPPHFSEEEAWLPAWLQPSNQPPQPLEEEIGRLQQSTSPREENGSLSNVHLFLSGDDDHNSPITSSTNHQLQYHLHLSSFEQDSQPDKSDFKVIPSLEGSCITDAIELAVAASEALTIHKVLKDQLFIASSAVLEAAIRLKHARLENLTDSLDETNDLHFDFPSDLDMIDAYEDVGLTVANLGHPTASCSISHVNDTFSSENNTSNANHKGGNILESCDNESLGTQNADLASDVDHVFNCSIEQTDFCEAEREGFAIRDPTSSQTILRSNDERQDKITNLVPDRFQSRWFGGWTMKSEESIPAVTNDKHKRTTNEIFANEMSSLSESADIAPDMSSCVQIRQDKDKTVAQSSVALQLAYENSDNNMNLVSGDVAVSPCVSPVDPMCSVVPCSYGSDCVASQNTEHQENLNNHLGSTVQPNSGNLILNRESSPAIHRQVASLKTYSMLYPTCDPYLDKEHARVDSSSLKHNQTAKADTALTGQHKETTKVSHMVESIVPRRKRVRFSETEICYRQAKKFQKTRLKDSSVASRICRRVTRSKFKPREAKKTNKILLQDLKFLLTGFSVKKHKQIKNLIQENGGIVFDDIPSVPIRKKSFKLPLILCPKKLLTTKFLYGCAVNASILNITWLFDSVDEGLILPHKKYKVLNDHATDKRFIFEDIAIMLHGKQDFCSKMGKVVKHGGGSVFKTFHWLVKSLDSKKVSVGVIVVEDENGISRQLKQCALEQKISVMPYSWIINSLYAGRLLPSPQLKLPDQLVQVELSEEI